MNRYFGIIVLIIAAFLWFNGERNADLKPEAGLLIENKTDKPIMMVSGAEYIGTIDAFSSVRLVNEQLIPIKK